jgi:type IX secretion system PorP/SprF family membrane protein
MRNGLLLIVLLLLILCRDAEGQSIHFSQYYNAPMLLSPANTGLMPDNDYRAGMNYRNQWSALPVPYNTFSGWGDLKVGGNKNNENHNNWLGLGGAFFNDKAGDLKLSEFQGNIAYHLQTSATFMISLGMSAAYVNRSVNYDNLTFDAQWDGVSFNKNLANGEKVGVLQTSYSTFAAGMNFAWFPSENVYIKLGGSAANINKPVESFYNSGKNVIGLRPSGTLDVLMRTGAAVILNPSVYYSQQTGASELVAGTMVRTMLTRGKGDTPLELILGGYYRLADAAIGVVGVKIGEVQFTANYDFTVSSLTPYNSSYGALEFSLIYAGKYYKNRGIKSSYTCPRFN